MKSLDLARFQPVSGESLSDLIRKFSDRLRFRKGKRQADISRDSWLDESYVSRLISGERANPSRDALILLGAFGLELAVHELDEVLMAADYKPLVLPQSLR
jgi:transcriptional regulator with XRE-family HTH domain